MEARKSALGSQFWSLAKKDLTILLLRNFTTTIYTALVLPVIMTVYLGIGQNLQGGRQRYGIGTPHDVRSFADGLAAADASRTNVVFVHNGLTGGDIENVIDTLVQQVEDAGKTAHKIGNSLDVGAICQVRFLGTTPCYAAVEFHSSPDEGEGGVWNYTLRGDQDLSKTYEVAETDNGAQIYVIPFQRAIDTEIARISAPDGEFPSLDQMREYSFTDITEDERKADALRDYQNTFVNFMGLPFLLGFFGIAYHLSGYISTEREKGLSQLIDAMMPTRYTWEAQAARMFAYFYAFSNVYFPGWLIVGIVAKFLIWKETSLGVVLPYCLIVGFAFVSQSLMLGTLFKSAQLSGVASSLVVILLGVVAQVVPNLTTAPVAVLSLLFAPCNLIFMVKYMSRWESEGHPTDLLNAPEQADDDLPGFLLWVFLGVQIFVCPFIAAFMERVIHGAASDSRSLWTPTSNAPRPDNAIVIEGLTKVYKPTFLSRIFSFIVKTRPPTVAVNNLSLSVKRGQIASLLGANGSGKSTTLDAVAGIHGFNQGKVTLDASGGIGIAPQKNVIWDELTVWEHIRLFNALKAPFNPANESELMTLLEGVGLESKKDALSGTLSGGQKRKLQLGMMLVGGSAVCCVDEVSSGIDPLSRRKIWDILLRERGNRTIILTTHFLDEADLLSDEIAIMSKGSLRAEGSAVELKHKLGAGYRIHVYDPKGVVDAPSVPGVRHKVGSNTVTYIAPTSELAANVIRTLESAGIPYRLSSPTIEDVFLHVAEEVQNDPRGGAANRDSFEPLMNSPTEGKQPLELLSGRKIGFFKQTGVLLHKRVTLFRYNWLPYVIAFLIPIIAAAIAQIVIADAKQSTCKPLSPDPVSAMAPFRELLQDAKMAAGPSVDESNFNNLIEDLNFGNGTIPLEAEDSFQQLQQYIEQNRMDIKPGGFWMGSQDDVPTIIYRGDDGNGVRAAVIAQNLLNSLRTNVTIEARFSNFDSSVTDLTKTLILAVIFCVVMSIVPSFLGLLPNVERRNNVRSLQYSSGVRSLPQWMSHLVFDFGVVLIPLIVAVIILSVTSDVFYNPGYLVPVFLLYAIAAILLAYIWSLFMSSQLATWAAATTMQGVGFAIYFIAFMFIMSLSAPTRVETDIQIAHWVIAIIFPIGSLARALFVSLNIFSTACDGPEFQSYPGAITAYGGPILYLTVQCVIYFCILLYHDSGNKLPSFMSSKTKKNIDPETGIELEPTSSSKGGDSGEGLEVRDLTKSFGDFTAVDDVSFNIKHDEVFALLGPNGAGKSTTISLIRGDLKPSPGGGDVKIENISVTDNRALARSNLGVCPQFDPIDNMTVLEHLRHYARLRGISDVPRQVDAVIRAVGLENFVHTMAPHLSGGNKRKLSLGMALTGNPSVILLDEPSSGLDAAAKRIMWRTLSTIVPGRSILLTTHSMEEADALATRAGILAKRMLAMGEVGQLQSRFGDSLYVHLVSATAPYSTDEEMERMRAWILNMFPTANIEAATYHGQLRFSVPAEAVLERSRVSGRSGRSGEAASPIGQLILMLEENKQALGIAHHSVSPTTLNEVFLSIVGRNNVQEEGYGSNKAGNKKMWRKMLIGF
jgi:ABC-type multidrug transport system ATPase subunit